MTTSIIGLFENGDIARKVADALIENGIEEDVIAILEVSPPPRFPAA